MRTALVLLAGLTVAASAVAQVVYRYVYPDGRVVYSDGPVPGARLQSTIAPPPPASPAPPPTALSEREKSLARAADERLRRLDELTTEIQSASRDLQVAQRDLEAGRAVREGDRIGTYGGRARFSEAYWIRQATNADAVADAQARLDRAVAERNSLR